MKRKSSNTYIYDKYLWEESSQILGRKQSNVPYVNQQSHLIIPSKLNVYYNNCPSIYESFCSNANTRYRKNKKLYGRLKVNTLKEQCFCKKNGNWRNTIFKTICKCIKQKRKSFYIGSSTISRIKYETNDIHEKISIQDEKKIKKTNNHICTCKISKNNVLLNRLCSVLHDQKGTRLVPLGKVSHFSIITRENINKNDSIFKREQDSSFVVYNYPHISIQRRIFYKETNITETTAPFYVVVYSVPVTILLIIFLIYLYFTTKKGSYKTYEPRLPP